MKTRGLSIMLSLITLVALVGCGPRAAGPSAAQQDEPTHLSQRETAAGTVGTARRALPAAGRAAVRYAMAARSWTPTSYRAQYRRQLGLSTGSLHSALEASAPTPDQLAAYQEDSVRLDATVLAAIPRVVSRSQAGYELVLDERSTAAGQSAHQRAAYLVDLQRRGRAWRVAAFSIEP